MSETIEEGVVVTQKQRRMQWFALDMRVIVVAQEGAVGDWAAYIGAVPGNRHTEEWEEVARHGSKLPEKVARMLFPSFRDLEWRS